VITKPVTDEALLKERIEQLTKENADLKKKVEQLTNLVEQDIVVSDPYFDWCDTHRDLLARYPNQVVAIDINRSEIVAHGADFAETLARFSGEYRSQLYVIHTALYS
jgi:hypothetical protein